MSEILQLSRNGQRRVVSERLSAKISSLKEKHPENPYQENSTGYSWDEAGMADLFADLYIDEIRFCPEAKSWYFWGGADDRYGSDEKKEDDREWRWIKDVGDLWINDRMKEFFRIMCLYCGEIEDDDMRKEYIKFVNRMGDRRFRTRIIGDAKDTKLKISITEFDSHPNLINCINGTFDLNTLSFKEPDPADFLTMSTSFKYTRGKPRYMRWEKFIDEVTEGDREKALYLQKALGYSLLGSAKEDCMFILHGKTTRNGKSTLLDAVQHLLGDYAKTAPVELICKSGNQTKSAESASPVLASLKGKRFVTMAESDSAGRIDESVLKQYTGGEEVSARELYQSSFTFLPQFTLWLSCNDLPAVRDKSLFASERVRVIEFNKHFSQAEQDKSLKDYFRTDEAMRGIFTWLIFGYSYYKKYGLVMPESMSKIVKKYERDNDVVLQFLESCCTRCEDDQMSFGKDLYARFKVWCRSQGITYIYSAKKFNADLTAHPEWYADKRTVRNLAAYYGLRLADSI